MTGHDRLAAICRRTPFLTVNPRNGECRLVDRAEGSRLLLGVSDTPFLNLPPIVLDLEAAANVFAKAAGRDDREFVIAEIAAVAGAPVDTVNTWTCAKIIRASIRPGS